MAFHFATVPPQPTLLEAKGGEELDKSHTVVDTVPEDDFPASAKDIIASALTSGNLATPEVTRGHGGQDIALVEADPFRAVPGLQESTAIAEGSFTQG